MAGRKREVGSPLDQASGRDVIWDNVCALFNAAKSIPDPSFVYFVGEEDGGCVKIGVAKDPIRRLWGMRTGNPRHLRIEHVVLGNGRCEKLFHEIWEPLGIRSLKNRNRPGPPGTEWFTPEIRPKVFPVVQEIAEAQCCLVEEHLPEDGEKWSAKLNHFALVLDAHSLHGYKPQEKARILGANGYAELQV